MLVLTRKDAQEIVIDGDIRIKILRTRHGKCQLGIDAPPECYIRRAEITPDLPDSGDRQAFAALTEIPR